MIDPAGNHHAPAGSPAGGQFTSHLRSAPAGALSAPAEDAVVRRALVVDYYDRRVLTAASMVADAEGRHRRAQVAALSAHARHSWPDARHANAEWDGEAHELTVTGLLDEDGGAIDADLDLVHTSLDTYDDFGTVRRSFAMGETYDQFTIPLKASPEDSSVTDAHLAARPEEAYRVGRGVEFRLPTGGAFPALLAAAADGRPDVGSAIANIGTTAPPTSGHPHSRTSAPS